MKLTDREAITMLEGCACTPVMRRAINKGVKAIQEKIEREKGCEHCKYDGCELCLNKGDMTICEDCADNVWTYCNHYKKSYFCRRCGRKLKPEDAE